MATRMMKINSFLIGNIIREKPAGAIMIINKCPVVYWEHAKWELDLVLSAANIVIFLRS